MAPRKIDECTPRTPPSAYTYDGSAAKKTDGPPPPAPPPPPPAAKPQAWVDRSSGSFAPPEEQKEKREAPPKIGAMPVEKRYPIAKAGMSEADVRKAASEIDANHDGKITNAEVGIFGSTGRARGFADKKAQALFRRMEAGAALMAVQGEQKGRQADKAYLDGAYKREMKKLGANDAEIADVNKTLAPQATTELGTNVMTPELKELDKGYTDHKSDPAARKTIAGLAKNGGFERLSADQRMALMKVADGTSKEYSGAARTELDKLMASPAFKSASAADQEKQLKDFLAKQPHLPSQTADTSKVGGPQVPYSLVPPAPSGSYPQKVEIHIDGRKIPVTIEDPGPNPGKNHTAEEIAKSIASSPKGVRDSINDVTIHGGTPGGGYMSTGAAKTLHVWPVTNKQSQNFATDTMLHESAHVLSDSKWGGSTSDPRWQGWKDAIAKDVNAPSAYGLCAPGTSHCTTVKDDFAETYRLYHHVKGTAQEAEMRRLMPERFKILDTM